MTWDEKRALLGNHEAVKRLTIRDESGFYHLRRGPKGGEINKITVVQHLGRLEDVALRPVSREQVEKVWRGEWIKHNGYTECSKCEYWYPSTEDEEEDDRNSFCPACGRAMTDEAVQMVMERLNKMEGMKK